MFDLFSDDDHQPEPLDPDEWEQLADDESEYWGPDLYGEPDDENE